MAAHERYIALNAGRQDFAIQQEELLGDAIANDDAGYSSASGGSQWEADDESQNSGDEEDQ